MSGNLIRGRYICILFFSFIMIINIIIIKHVHSHHVCMCMYACTWMPRCEYRGPRTAFRFFLTPWVIRIKLKPLDLHRKCLYPRRHPLGPTSSVLFCFDFWILFFKIEFLCSFSYSNICIFMSIWLKFQIYRTSFKGLLVSVTLSNRKGENGQNKKLQTVVSSQKKIKSSYKQSDYF